MIARPRCFLSEPDKAPRTECGSQPVSCCNSGSDAQLGARNAVTIASSFDPDDASAFDLAGGARRSFAARVADFFARFGLFEAMACPFVTGASPARPQAPQPRGKGAI